MFLYTVCTPLNWQYKQPASDVLSLKASHCRCGVLQGLAQELRRSAAEELLALSPEPHLLEVMLQHKHLHDIWQLCVPPE